MFVYDRWSHTSRGEGDLLGILGGVCRPVLQILTLLQNKKCQFSHLFSDLASKKLCLYYLD